MTDNRSSAEIEREIEEERHALARSLENLQTQFSPERLVNQAGTYLRSNGGDFAKNLVGQVRDNPLAAAIAGVGIAWLLYGSSRPLSAPTYDRAKFTHDPRYGDGTGSDVDRRPPGYAGAATYDDRPYESAPGSLSRSPYPGDDYEDRLATASGSGASDDGPSAWDRTKAGASSAGDRAQGAYASARAGLAGARDSTASSIDDAEHGIADRWGSAREGTSRRWQEWRQQAGDRVSDARGRASSARGRLYERSQDLRARIGEGTEGMSEQARMRVMQARQAAADAQHQLEARFGEARATGQRLYEEQPLLGGAIAFAVGAAIGASLPRTDVEDEYVGVYRDRLFDDADRVFREESSKLRAVANAALDEARSVADEKAESVKGATPSGRDAVDSVRGGGGAIGREPGERGREGGSQEAGPRRHGEICLGERGGKRQEVDDLIAGAGERVARNLPSN